MGCRVLGSTLGTVEGGLTVGSCPLAQGFWSPQSGGGSLFYAWPHGKAAGIGEAARLEYEVFFPEGFPWVKGGCSFRARAADAGQQHSAPTNPRALLPAGGKLPGLLGGDTGCSGGASAEDCFSGERQPAGRR
jgi:hypothetical protein